MIKFKEIAINIGLMLKNLWSWSTALLGKIMTAVVLALFYYTLFTPFALVLRLFKKELFDIKARMEQNTYWIPKSEKDPVYERPY